MISRITKVEVSVISQSRRLRLITLTETLIILDITKTESNNFFLLYIVLKQITTNALSHRTQFIFDAPCSYFTVPACELDIALGNHALCAQPTDYSLICRLCCFPELTVGFQPMRRQMVSTMYNENN